MGDRVKIFGDDNANTITGSNGPEYIYGLGGDDLIDGSGGNDHLDGGTGADTLLGGKGNDQITAGEDAVGDSVDGGSGADQLTGYGADTLLGGDDNDQIYATATSGGLLDGGAGQDALHLVLGGAQPFNGDLSGLQDGGELVLNGVTVRGFEFGGVTLGAGDDQATVAVGFSLGGGAGDDLLIGSGHSDTLDGGSGADTLKAGGGDDLLSALGSGGRIEAGAGNDTINVLKNETVLGGSGQDVITGANGNNLLAGNDGDDTLISSNAHDTLKGGDGRDVLAFGLGPDKLDGGHGNDIYRIDGRVIQAHDLADQTYIVRDASIGQLDLSSIDADTSMGGDQAFHIVQSLSGHAGELAIAYDAADNVTTVQGDLDGDGVADLMFTIRGDQTDLTEYAL